MNVRDMILGAIGRAKVAAVQAGAIRTVLQVKAYSGETFSRVELLLPYGMTALPGPGGDLLLFEVGGTRNHKVAIGADDPSLRIGDLAPGEFGFRDAHGSQVVFRGGFLEVSAASVPVKIKAPQVRIVSPDIRCSTSIVTDASIL